MMALAVLQSRRETRQPVEMMARFRHDISTVTVMLKDITRHGARVEGVGPLDQDDAAFLILPGMAPKLSFVAWSNDHAAGLEFAESLDPAAFSLLIANFGRRNEVLSKVA
jgi:hypothetical protein